MRIRSATDNDAAGIHAIQLQCPQAAQWRIEDYRQLTGDPLGTLLVAEIEDANPSRIIGFAAFHRAVDEAELRNMAVEPGYRRSGIARALLAAGISALHQHGVSTLFLEVRASNVPAIAFYTSAGFHLLNRRRDYYHDPAEDALVMVCNIASDSPPLK